MSVHSAKGADWERLRIEVLDRDMWVCQYCGAPANTADHIVPRSKGGEDSAFNLVASCRPCNSRKGDRPITRLSGWADGWGPR